MNHLKIKFSVTLDEMSNFKYEFNASFLYHSVISSAAVGSAITVASSFIQQT